MKQKLILICLGFYLSTSLFATDFLAEEDQYLLHFFQQSGTPSRLYLECEKDYLTNHGNNTLHFKLGGEISWYNVRAKFAACWYIFNFGKFDLHYRLYYRKKGGSYKEATAGEFEYIDQEIELHTATQLEGTRTIAFIEQRAFEHEFDWKFPLSENPGAYEFMVELEIKPSSLLPTGDYVIGRHYEVGSTNIFCPYESAIAYINGEKGQILHQKNCAQNKAGGQVALIYERNNRSVEYGSDETNPRNQEGYRLIYNHPQAEFNLSLSTENTPKDTLIESFLYHGYTSFLVGIGDSYELPTKTDFEKEFNSCLDGQKGTEFDFNCFNYINYRQYKLKNYLQQKFKDKELKDGNINDYSKYGIVHFKAILLQSNNPTATHFNDVASSKLSDYQPKDGKWFSRTYHLRDLEFVKSAKTTIQDNTVFKVWNKMVYTRSPWIDIYRALGCAYYGPIGEYMRAGVSKENNYPFYYTSQNCILYKVVPQASLKPIPHTSIQRVCINTEKNPANFTTDDFIHLKGQSIECGNFSPSIYRPQYGWQISEDKIHWENISNDNPFLVNKAILPYNIVMDKEKDLLINTAILQPNKPLYFRQTCILQAFSSQEESNLYNYPITLNNKKQFFIAIYGENYYSYLAIPKATQENFAWVNKDWSNYTYLCPQEQLENEKLEFQLEAGSNFSPEELEIAQARSNFKIYHVNSKGEKQLVSLQNSYTIPDTLTQSCEYECVIQFSRDSISRKATIIKYPTVNINLNSIVSEAAIQTIDSVNKKIELVGLRKINTLQFNDREPNCRFLQRQVLPYIPPTLYQEDWSTLSRQECLFLLTSRLWDFEAETGESLQKASLNRIQAYGIEKQRKENQKLYEAAIQDSIQKNQWKPIEDDNAQLAFLIPKNKEKDTYYFKKINGNGCESDSIQISIQYCPPVEGNQLRLKNSSKDTLYAIAGLGNPYIMGSYPVEGGYGPVNPEKGTSYTYQWMKKSSNNNWEPILVNYHLAAITDSGKKVINSETKYISLTENTLKKLEGKYEIARFVHSRLHNNQHSQITSISNSIFVITIDSLSMKSVQMDENKCPTEEIDITIKEPGNVLNEYTTYLWNFSRSDISYEILSTGYGKQNNRCIIKNANKDFKVYVKRFDPTKNLESNVLRIPIDISSHRSRFSIAFDDQKYKLEDTLIVNVGSKIQLINESPKAEDCKNTWTLQLQTNFLGDHQTVEGTQSNKVNTACYLYNLGRNPIQLTTLNPKGCKSTVIAQNIFVEGIPKTHQKSYFVTEDEGIRFSDFQWVGPTLLNASNHYVVRIETNKEHFEVRLCNSLGKELIPLHTQQGSCEYQLNFLLPGIYILQVDQTSYKLRIL